MFLRDLTEMRPRAVNDVFGLLAIAMAAHIVVVAGVILESLHAAA